ncbi:MAG TPA: hypothetical protein VGD86_04290 [Devosia sp.]
MIEGTLAIILAFICFLVPMAVPLFAQRWRTLVIVLLLGAVFFGWLTLEMDTPGTIPAGIGAFLGGLMLFGFAAGAIAKFVALVGQR